MYISFSKHHVTRRDDLSVFRWKELSSLLMKQQMKGTAFSKLRQNRLAKLQLTKLILRIVIKLLLPISSTLQKPTITNPQNLRKNHLRSVKDLFEKLLK